MPPGTPSRMLPHLPVRVSIVVISVLIAACSASVDATILTCDDCTRVRVNRVIDGDTFDSPSGRIRLFGVDTPERSESCASEAASRLRDLAGGSVRLEDGPRLADRFGRRLAYVYTGGGLNIDEILVREGLAEAWTGDGQHRDFLVELERTTREAESECLWSK